MPTDKFLKHCKTRRAELQAELEALGKIVRLHEGTELLIETVPGSPLEPGETRPITTASVRYKSMRISAEDRPRLNKLVLAGSPIDTIVDRLGGRYTRKQIIRQVYLVRKRKKEGKL